MDETQYNSIKGDLKEIKENVKEINGRVRKLEIWRGIMLGVGIVLTVLIVPLTLLLFERSL